MGRTLQRYLILQVLGPFLAGLALFTFILFVARILKLAELVVNRGVPLSDILKLFAFILPTFFEVTVPMALLLACLMACGRLSADHEWTALRASGLSLYQICTPFAAFSLAICFVSLGLSLYGRPWSNAALKAELFQLARTRASAGLREHVFNDEFRNLVIYVEQIDPGGANLHRILISDRRRPESVNTVFATRGSLVADEQSGAVHLRLADGVIFTSEGESHGFHKTDFTTYEIRLDLMDDPQRTPGRERTSAELTNPDLRARIAAAATPEETRRQDRIEQARRWSLPFSCLVLPLVGIPLGLQPVRAVRSRGLAVSVALILSYYVLLSAGDTAAQNGNLPPDLALWLPNLAFGLVGAWLFHRAANELPAWRRAFRRPATWAKHLARLGTP